MSSKCTSSSPSLSTSPTPPTPWEQLLSVMAALRHPQTGCPWDLKQTHASLKPYLLEESLETLDAIDAVHSQSTPEHIQAFQEELGDVLLQVVLHAQIAHEAGWFTAHDVAQTLVDKMIRRHPHVFSNSSTGIHTAEAVTQQWADIKARESNPTQPHASVLEGVSKQWPALMQAAKLSQKAVKAGFAWPNEDSLWDCVMSEVAEFKAETAVAIPERLEDELGDILFAFTSLANHYGIDAETALHRANSKFTQRFHTMEKLHASQNPKQALQSLSFNEWETLWKRAKQSLSQ